MVTPADLTMLRATQNSLMPGTAEIVRRTDGTRDAFGDVTETWATVATVPCRLAAAKLGNAGGEVVTVFGALTGVTQFDLTLPWNTDIRGKDRVKISGRMYEVKADPDDALSYRTAVRVGLIRLETAQ